MRRFSIRALMAGIVITALAMAALKNASAFWSGVLVMVALAVAGFAMLGAMAMRGREQHWWRGFALFSGCYLALALGLFPGETLHPPLGTTHLLGQLHEQMHPAMVTAKENLETLVFERQRKTSFLESLLSRSPRSDSMILSVQGQIISLDQQIGTDQQIGASFDRLERAISAVLMLASSSEAHF
jgi:hypothetical protein